jgi:hypothetical protein
MATAQSIIVQALQQTLSIDSGGSTLPSEDLNAGLTTLINMLDYFQLSPQDTVGIKEHVYTPTVGSQFVTIGASGAQITAPMPQRIEESSFCRLGGADFLIGFAPSFEEYSGQPVKTTEGYPSKCFYIQSNTNIGTLYLWPASNGAELHLWVRETPVNGFASMTLTSTLTLPMGMQKVLVDCLAAELMDIFGVQEPEYSRIRIKANNSLRVWKRSNLKVSTLRMPVGVGSYTSNAFTG